MSLTREAIARNLSMRTLWRLRCKNVLNDLSERLIVNVQHIDLANTTKKLSNNISRSLIDHNIVTVRAAYIQRRHIEPEQAREFAESFSNHRKARVTSGWIKCRESTLWLVITGGRLMNVLMRAN